MGGQSRTEVNLQRLLRHCETMATEAQHKEAKVNWRLAKVYSLILAYPKSIYLVLRAFGYFMKKAFDYVYQQFC